MSLPDLFPFHGDWSRYEDELYAIYLDTIIRSGIKFRGLPVKARYQPATKNKGYSFWHLISEGELEEDRTPDIRRCERIRWIAWLIENAETQEDLSWWENKRGSNTHIVIWHERENFAVVLAKRNGYFLLRSAYWVKKHRRKDFVRERKEFRGH
jgi:hypothetical protein